MSGTFTIEPIDTTFDVETLDRYADTLLYGARDEVTPYSDARFARFLQRRSWTSVVSVMGVSCSFMASPASLRLRSRRAAQVLAHVRAQTGENCVHAVTRIPSGWSSYSTFSR